MKFTDDYLSAKLYRRLAGVLGDVFFVSDRENKLPVPDANIFVDLKPEIGPLGGLYTALSHAANEYCFISACDLPFLSAGLIKILWHNRTSDSDIIVPVWQSKIEPLAAFYHKRCIKEIELVLNTDHWMMKGFWDRVKTEYIDMSIHFDSETLRHLFFNINTPADYKLARTIYKKSES